MELVGTSRSPWWMLEAPEMAVLEVWEETVEVEVLVETARLTELRMLVSEEMVAPEAMVEMAASGAADSPVFQFMSI